MMNVRHSRSELRPYLMIAPAKENSTNGHESELFTRFINVKPTLREEI